MGRAYIGREGKKEKEKTDRNGMPVLKQFTFGLLLTVSYPGF